jgi:putative aldouronate transport system permease protein
MKVDFYSATMYNWLLRITLALAGVLFLVGPSVWISRAVGFNNITVSGHHILLGNSGLEGFMRNISTSATSTASLNPQAIMIVGFVLLIAAIALTFKKKKTFLVIPLILFSLALTWLACDHFGWLERSPYELQWGFWAYFILLAVSMVLTLVSVGLSRLKTRSGEFKDHMALLTMLVPGTVFLVIFAYLPMPGILIAFKNLRLHGTSLFENFFKSDWVGLRNFRFMFATPDAWTMTRNTVGYNLIFITLGLVAAVAIAIGITEISNRRTAKLYQTLYFLPFFLSWVVVSYLAWALLNYEFGALNNILRSLNMNTVEWYMERGYWPYIFVIANLWKYAGNGSIIYTATIVGMDPALFEAAAIDGANKAKQIWYITLPMLKPIMILLTILAIGRVFNADFGLFYLLPRNAGQLRSVSMVIDVYVFNGLAAGTINIGMIAAAALYQSTVGFILILTTNWIVSKISPDNTLL